MALHDKSDTAKVKHLFITGAECQLLLAKIASTSCANMLLKCPVEGKGQY